MKAKITAVIASLALSPLAYSQTEASVVLPANHRPAGVTETYSGIVNARQRVQMRADGALKADFSIAGASTGLESYVVQNFDNGQGDWTFDPTENVVWSIKRIAGPGEDRSFSAIDPDDVSSLFVEGPYQVWKRERSSARTPQYEIRDNAVLTMYVGFSMNYDDVCRLSLKIVIDGEETEIWNSSQETGEKPWRWHDVSVDLSAYAGKEASFTLTYDYGSSDEIFKTGGYQGDFAIDGFKLSAAKAVEELDVATGEKIEFIDISAGDVVSWQWTFEGGVPATSAEPRPVVYYTAAGDYDVTLRVTAADGTTAEITRENFVHVTGRAPEARILPPATFRFASTRLAMVAPMVPVTFTDASDGFPSAHEWAFTGVDADNTVVTTSAEANPVVAYSYLHNQAVGLTAVNDHGSSTDAMEVSVEYDGLINNLRPDDQLVNFDMSDWGLFPGSNNRKITAYAEHFSAPSVPSVINGVNVYFTHAEATELIDQIASIGVHLYTSKDGLPDRRIESNWWTTIDLDTPDATGAVRGTFFGFTPQVVRDDFFIVVDGIPENHEGTCVAFAMAGFRPTGNTAYMLKEDRWIAVPDYFGDDKCTSYAIAPSLIHSVMSVLPMGSEGEFETGPDGGTIDISIFSYMGYKTPVETTADWIHLDSTPNRMTVDDLKIGVDAYAGEEDRFATMTLTDGVTDLRLNITQHGGRSSIGAIGAAEMENCDVYNLQGIKIINSATPAQISSLPRGVYILGNGLRAVKIVK